MAIMMVDDYDKRIQRAVELLRGFVKRKKPVSDRMLLAQAVRCCKHCGLQVEGAIDPMRPIQPAGHVMFTAKLLEKR